MKNIAIILAGGNGKRFDNSTPKQFLYLNKRRIIDYSISTFNNHQKIDKTIIVCHKEWIKIISKEYPNHKIVIGGKTRQESSFNGLIACPKITKNVFIHDAARPFVSSTIISNSIDMLGKYDAINLSIPSLDTAIIEKNKLVDIIPKRRHVFLNQTPQSFKYQTILKAHKKYTNKDLSDDIQLAKKMNVDCYNLKGEIYNIKITHENDMKIADLIISSKKNDIK